jgi:mRNA interferase HigB
MHLMSIRQLRDDATRYPDAQQPIEDWYNIVRRTDWSNLEEVKGTYRDAEAVGNFTVFNIKGNKYRLIVDIDYESGTIYHKYFLTHADYDKDRWKNDPYF